MIGSVRARLTVAVAVIVGGVALATALAAPRIVHDSLIEDRIDAQRDLEAAEMRAQRPAIDVTAFGTVELTAVFGPDVAVLTRRLDSVDALAELRAVDPARDLHVLAAPDLIATVTVEGVVRVQPDPNARMDAPVVSKHRLERLAADYGFDRRYNTAPLLEVSPTFDAFLDDFEALFSIEIDDYLDPRVDRVSPRELYEDLQDQLAGTGDAVAEADTLVDPGDIVVGTRTIDDRPVLLTASMDGIDNTVSRLRTLLWIGLPVAVASAALLTWLLAGRSLRPVAAITERTRQIRSSTLHERVPVPNSHDEIAGLATEMNTMLDRVQREDERRRQFISDASHELRSPIATIRAQAESALAHPASDDAHDNLRGDDIDGLADDTGLAAGVLAEAERMSVLVDDLLALARHDEHLAPPGTVVDLDDLVYAEAARPRRVPVDIGAVSAGQVRGRPDELARVITHLLDNAARHAVSRVAISLSTGDDDGGVTLVVDDDGEGIPPDDRERVFERFVRLDDARSRDSGGSGLGLAVVHTVVRSMGGTITVDQSPWGGARFRAEFPAAE